MGTNFAVQVNKPSQLGPVLLAVPESDCHVVACKLLQIYLESLGYEVHNLGVTTPSVEIAEAAELYQPVAIFLSSQNGHALMDLQTLTTDLKQRGITVPVYLGGNLTVGCQDSPQVIRQSFANIGIEVLGSFEDAARKLLTLPVTRMSALNSSSDESSVRLLTGERSSL